MGIRKKKVMKFDIHRHVNLLIDIYCVTLSMTVDGEKIEVFHT